MREFTHPQTPSAREGAFRAEYKELKTENGNSRQSVNLWIFRYAQYDKIQAKPEFAVKKITKFNFLNAKIKAFPRTKYFR